MRAVVQYECSEVVFTRPAARRLQVVPDRPGRSLDAVEKVGVSVQSLSLRELARGEFAEEFDVVGRCERLQHRSHLVCPACTGQFGVIVGERVVDRVEPSAGCGGVELPCLHEVMPEDERMSVVAVWAGRKQVAWLDDWCAGSSSVPGDTEFPFDVARIDARSAAGYARDHWRGPQVHEHVPRLAQHDWFLAMHAVGISDCDRGFDCTHDAIVDPTFWIPDCSMQKGSRLGERSQMPPDEGAMIAV